MRKIILGILIFFLFCLVGCTNTPKETEKNIKNVISLIDTLPNASDITLDNEDLVYSIMESYNNLPEEDKSKVTNYNKLFEAMNKIDLLNENQNLLIEEIEELISELPNLNRINLNHRNMFEDILELLDELTEFNKELVDGLDYFNKAYEAFKAVEKEDQLKKEASSVIELIKDIPEDNKISPNNEEQIKDIRSKYDSLSEEAKPYVTNYDKLLTAEGIVSYMNKYNDFNPEQILATVSDKPTTSTVDTLYTGNDLFSVEWTSSNNELYVIKDGCGKVSIINQRHKSQLVTVTATINFNDGDQLVITKEIKVAPVSYSDLPDTPVATYFQTSALSSYLNYSQRYKEEGTLFSEKARDVLNILYYAFATPTENGDVYLSDLNVLDQLMKLKEDNVRIVMSIAGVSATASTIFKNLTADSTKRTKFVNNIVNLVEKYGFDGVDIDWESATGAYVVAENMNLLVKDLRKKLDDAQEKGGSPYLLTAAIPATSWGTEKDRFDFKTLNQYLDHINMMTYDLNNPDKATHLSALYTSSNDKGFGFSVQYGVNLYTSRGFDKSKIIIGAAGYGKAYKLTNDTSTSSKYPGISSVGKLSLLDGIPGSHASGTVFLNAIEVILKTGKYKKYLEYNSNNQLVGSYLYNEQDKIFITYDSEEIMSEKYKYALSNEGMGIMCWAYTEDTADTYVNSIYDIKNG